MTKFYTKKGQASLRKAVIAAAKSVQKPDLNAGQVRQVKKIIDKAGETKHHTLVQGITTIDAANPHNTCLSLVSQGDNDSQRNGDKIRIKNIKILIRAYIQGSDANSPKTTAFRFMVVQDKAYNTASALTLAQLTTAVAVTSQRNVDFMKTLVVLYDKIITLDIASDSAKTFWIKPNLKFLKRDIQYAAASSENQTGGLYFVIYNDSNATVDPAFEYSSRITYTDK